MSSTPSPWYAGRFVQRRGPHGTVDVEAVSAEHGWELVKSPRTLFPKSGQVEMLLHTNTTLRRGDWLAFQIASAVRPRPHSFTILTHRLMPRYVDMERLGSIEATRAFFSTEGWEHGGQPGHWAVRFAPDRVLLLDLARDRNGKLHAQASGLQRIPCYEFDAQGITRGPATSEASDLYDFGERGPFKIYDWSPDSDYIAHVVRSLLGESDPRLVELIAWLELHRDSKTGDISVSDADRDQAFEAIRSGELAARLTSDKELMQAYLAAVRNDPAITNAVATAIAEASKHERESSIAALREEFARDHVREKDRQDAELLERRSQLEAALQERISQREQTLELELTNRISASRLVAEAQAVARQRTTEQEISALERARDALLTERSSLQAELAMLADRLSASAERRRIAEDELTRLSAAALTLTPGLGAKARTLTYLPGNDEARGVALKVDGLESAISRMALLTPHGKELMRQFSACLLAGEIPVLNGAEADDFSLIAESLIAAGGLVPFDVDSTILTPEDIWSKPGSGIVSPVAQAAENAHGGERTFLVQLRGIERSAARFWYPSLSALVRRGLLPRRLLLFASIMDVEAEEAKALPPETCRIAIAGAIANRAALMAPSLLGMGPTSIAFQLDPGERPGDLSSALTLIAELGIDISVGMSLRVAQVAIEATRLRPDDKTAALTAARTFCESVGCTQLFQTSAQGGRRDA